MKKTVTVFLAILLILISLFSGAPAGEEFRFVTIQEWLDARGECGSCLLLLKI